MAIRYSTLVLAFIVGVCFVFATPQQQQQQTSSSTPTLAPSSSTTKPDLTCVTCPSVVTCSTPCGVDESCILTTQTCDKCPTASCQPDSKLLQNTENATTSNSSLSSPSKIVPIAIGGVCGGLGVAAAIAGLIWYRQRRRSQGNQSRYGAQLNTTGVYAGSRHNMSGFKSPYAASRQTGFSEENASTLVSNTYLS
jgi:hypothetical protein